MRTARVLLSLTILVASPTVLAARQSARPTAQAMLEQVGAYVADVMTRFSAVIGEERYVEAGRRPRVVKSDVLFLKSSSATTWSYFRDTFESAGGVVRPHEDRLTRLFESPATVGQELAKIESEQRRYQNGSGRAMSNPLLVLAFLQSGLQSRFEFSVRGEDRGVGRDVWILEYKETQRPTLLRADGDRPVKGRAWVERGTGRVLKTQLQTSVIGSTAEVTTSFQVDDVFQVAVPVEMREEYLGSTDRLVATTTYARFRPLQPQSR